MILSPKFLEQKGVNVSPKQITETLIGLIAQDYICNSELILGDDGMNHLPDLHAKDNSIGYEIVQSELVCDYQKNTIYKVMAEEGFEYARVWKRLAQKKFPINNFSFSCNSEGIIVSFKHKEFFRKVNYLNEIHLKNIRNKLQKLNNGNYSSCKQINLIICSIARPRGFYEAEQVNMLYDKEMSGFKKSFDNVFLITNKGVYWVYPELEIVTSIKDTFTQYIHSMWNLLGLTE